MNRICLKEQFAWVREFGDVSEFFCVLLLECDFASGQSCDVAVQGAIEHDLPDGGEYGDRP